MQTFSPLAQWHLFSNAKALHDENDVQRSHQARSVVLLLPLCHFRFPLRRQLCWKCVWTARKMNCNDCLMMTPGIPASGNYKMHRLCVLRSCVCVIVACVEEPRRDRERWKPDFQRIALQCCLVLLYVYRKRKKDWFSMKFWGRPFVGLLQRFLSARLLREKEAWNYYIRPELKWNAHVDTPHSKRSM